jgi:hypothetical protein
MKTREEDDERGNGEAVYNEFIAGKRVHKLGNFFSFWQMRRSWG